MSGARATFGKGRRLGILGNVAAMVFLAAAASALGVYVTGFTDLRRRFDLTESRTYTLRPQTLRLLEGLDRDVEIVTVFDRVTWWWDFDRVWIKAMDHVEDLLQEYRLRSGGKVTVERLDPKVDIDRIRDLYQELDLQKYNLVIVRSGSNRRILGLDTDLAEFDLGSPQPVVRPTRLLAYRTEEALSSAIWEVTHARSTVAYALTGHEEVSTDSAADLGASLVAAALGQDNVEVRPLSLVAAGEVPEDADVVLLLGPRRPFLDEERTALDAYLRRGGRLLVTIDPLGDRSLDATIFRKLGVDIERNIVCHTQYGVLRAERATEMWIGRGAPGRYGDHPIVDALEAEGEVVRIVRSGALSPLEGTEERFTSLLYSHPDAFGDLPVDDTTAGDYRLDPRVEKAHTRTLAAALEPSGDYEGARCVFFASQASFTNFVLARSPGNEKLLRRSVAWLVGRKRSIVLPPRTVTTRRMDLRPGDEDAIFRYCAVYLPAGALVLGLLVFLARRR